MPTSDWDTMPAICKEIHRLQPQSVMDLGVGAGKYGVLAREVLDGQHGRVRPELWTHRIVGIEAHGPYRNPAWGAYDWVGVSNFTETIIAGHGLVLVVDALEHLLPEQGRAFLAALVRDNKHVIVSVPLGLMNQGATFGNDYECHRTTFHGHEFSGFPGVSQLHRGLCLAVSIPGGS